MLLQRASSASHAVDVKRRLEFVSSAYPFAKGVQNPRQLPKQVEHALRKE